MGDRKQWNWEPGQMVCGSPCIRAYPESGVELSVWNAGLLEEAATLGWAIDVENGVTNEQFGSVSLAEAKERACKLYAEWQAEGRQGVGGCGCRDNGMPDRTQFVCGAVIVALVVLALTLLWLSTWSVLKKSEPEPTLLEELRDTPVRFYVFFKYRSEVESFDRLEDAQAHVQERVAKGAVPDQITVVGGWELPARMEVSVAIDIEGSDDNE